MKTITHRASYKVSNGPIHLSIAIGDGQFGSSLVVVGDKVFDHERQFNKEIGLGSELVGKKITAVSMVTDTNPSTNRTSLTYRLRGGVASLEHLTQFTVEEDNDSVQYIAEIELVA